MVDHATCVKRITGLYVGESWRCGLQVAGWRHNKAYCWKHLS